MLVFILQTLFLLALAFFIGLFLARFLKKRFCKNTQLEGTNANYQPDSKKVSFSSHTGGVQPTTGFSAKSASMWKSPVSRNDAAAAATVAALGSVATIANTARAKTSNGNKDLSSSHAGGVQPTTGFSAKSAPMWNSPVSRNEAAAAATVAALGSVATMANTATAQTGNENEGLSSSHSGGVQPTTGFSAKSAPMWSSPVSRNEAAAAATVAALGSVATIANTATAQTGNENEGLSSSHSGGVQPTTGFSAKSAPMWNSPVSRNEAAAAATVAALGSVATIANTATAQTGNENEGMSTSHSGGVQPTTGFSAKSAPMWNSPVSRNNVK